MLEEIEPQAISLTRIQPGSFDIEARGEHHTKVAFCTIAAQAVAGGYELECARGRGRTEGGLFLAQAGETLKIWHHADARGRMQARWLHFTVMLYETVDLMALLDIPVVVDADHAGGFTPLLEALARPAAPGLEGLMRQRELAYGVVREMCRVSRLSARGEAMLAVLPRLQPLFSLIDRAYAEPLSVEAMASEIHVSRSRLFGLFKTYVGMGPQEYLKRTRIRKATGMLVTTHLAVYEIAELVGFDNPYHFGREFRRIIGMPPGRYRRNYLG